MSSFSLSLDDIDINNTNICVEDSKTQNDAQDKINEINNKTNQLNYCDDTCIKKENHYGTTGTICSINEKVLLKVSNMPEKIMETVSNPTTLCSKLMEDIDLFENENRNSIAFAELSNIFPNNIMKIHNTSQCKVSNKEYYYNVQYIEKIDGLLLKSFIESCNDEIIKLQIMLQLLYVLVYCNMRGYYHNDLKFDNIILKRLDTDREIIYDNIILENNKIELKLESNLYAVLIDFSHSMKINVTHNMHDLTEVAQLLNLFKNYFKNDRILKLIDSIKILFGDSTNFIVGRDIGGRLMAPEDINNNDYKLTENKILEIFTLIRNFANEINNKMQINIKLNSQHGSGDKYYHKYLKYKNKYLRLKHLKNLK